MARQNCSCHCRGYPFGGCDSHFSSLGAFEAHRRGGMCLDPAEVKLEAHEGQCKLQKPMPEGPVMVWSPLLTEEERRKSQERLSALRGGRLTASEDQT